MVLPVPRRCTPAAICPRREITLPLCGEAFPLARPGGLLHLVRHLLAPAVLWLMILPPLRYGMN
jgi:hypothetical protein